jgi:hypothetical protein
MKSRTIIAVTVAAAAILLVIALAAITTSNLEQQVRAISFKEVLKAQKKVEDQKIILHGCNKTLELSPSDAGSLDLCDKMIIDMTTILCNNKETRESQIVRQSGLCEDPQLASYIDARQLWNKIPEENNKSSSSGSSQ